MPSSGWNRSRAEKPALLCENQVQGEYSMKNSYLQEETEIIRKQQGPRGPVWMCGEQLLEMIAPGRDETRC